jgi:hypothetical protein
LPRRRRSRMPTSAWRPLSAVWPNCSGWLNSRARVWPTWRRQSAGKSASALDAKKPQDEARTTTAAVSAGRSPQLAPRSLPPLLLPEWSPLLRSQGCLDVAGSESAAPGQAEVRPADAVWPGRAHCGNQRRSPKRRRRSRSKHQSPPLLCHNLHQKSPAFSKSCSVARLPWQGAAPLQPFSPLTGSSSGVARVPARRRLRRAVRWHPQLTAWQPSPYSAARVGQSVDTSNSLGQTDFSQAGPGSIDTDEVDPVAEADVYMAYGRDAQAEEILLEAKQKDPRRFAIHLKLLEIYLSRKDVKPFDRSGNGTLQGYRGVRS